MAEEDQWSDNSDPGSEGRAGDGVSEQLSQQDMLLDRGVEDLLDEGYSPPDREPSPHASTEIDESLDDRLSEEEPDVGAAGDPTVDDNYEVGGARSGRLVDAENDGFSDVEKDLVAEDVGYDGAAASAEEAAVHVFDEDADDDSDDGDPYPDGELVDGQ
ncbi:DUF5709 domain-containing protein [Nakamurella lactea]|uniref:DUF5709 domain-containing protein n=1 Tax=Nakamurella lactea TaxID=459515 RepID=UPI0003F7F662|nr:DUF5709 domain-containing protein [Nakamurella lactea]